MGSHGPVVVALRRACALLVLLLLLCSQPAVWATPAPPQAPDSPAISLSVDPITDIIEEAKGKIRVSTEAATGRVGFVRADRGGDLFPDSEARPALKASDYLEKYGDVFGAPRDQLVQTSAVTDEIGTTVTFTQRYRGVPVFGSQLNANFDAADDLIAVNGFAVPDLDLSVVPSLNRTEAARRAIAAVRADPPKPADGSTGGTATDLRAADGELLIYRQGSLRGLPGETVLVWRVLVSNHREISEQVFVAANSGKIINRYSTMPAAIDRELINVTGPPIWVENDPLPGALNADQQRIVNASGDAYWFFHNSFGRDSFDDAGSPMISALNPVGLVCPGANWNGTRTNFCSGVTADDVVAHEWAHAYTESDSDLVYQFQSGALNEAYSDIWGETIDLLNARDDEEEGDLSVKRTVDACTTHTPVQSVLSVTAPAELARDCLTTGALFGPTLTADGISAGLVAAVDPDEDGIGTASTNQDGCSAYTNTGTVTGKIALVDRAGGCSFVTKATRAQNAGAIGLVVVSASDTLQSLTGEGPSITIPSVMIRRGDGAAIRASLLSGSQVSATMRGVDDVRQESHRWLIGEDVTNPGGVSRDLWNPNCLGDPGKVTDAEYYCASTDAGGVHHNSGIPSHAYTLLVDGGTYNGVSVTGIGLDKAAAIHYRAQTNYLTRVSDFGDHADALRAACTALIGQPISTLTTTPAATPSPAAPITATDCNSVIAVIAATQLRTTPTQCGVLLDPNAPAPCGDGHSRKSLFTENFTDGLAGWSQLNEIENPGGTGYPWTSFNTNPAKASGTHGGAVAYARDTNQGNCSGGAGDVTSRDALISPPILIDTTAITTPRLTFDHYVATEDGVDGGNVKIKLNDGDWLAVPNAAYIFNPMTKELTAAGNENPLAGQEAFTGTNGGLATGSWGQSQIDLSYLGVAEGDTIQLMFDFGRDGCFGLADDGGWYLDNINLSVCRVKVSVTPTQLGKPSTYGKAAKITVTVGRDGTTGIVPNGVITLRNATGTTLDSANLVAGKASLTLSKTLAVGKHTLTASYAGTPVFEFREATITATVAKASSKTAAKPTPKKPQFRENFTVAVKVGSDVAANGVVKVFKGNKLLGKATVRDGVATVKVKKNLKSGKYKLRAEYAGSSTVAASEDSFKIRVR